MSDILEESENEGVLDPDYLALRAEIEKDLDDGESGDSLNEAEEEVAPEPDGPEVRQPAAVAATEDPWAGVNPALKAAFTSMTEQVTSLGSAQDRVKQLESRVGSITNELHAAKAAAVTTKVAPTDEQMAAATDSDKKWEELKADFPDWADAFEGRFNAIKAGGGEDVTALKTEIEAIKTDLAGKASEADIQERMNNAVMSFAHPKWKDTVASSDYAAWLVLQKPEFITMAETSRNTDEAISVLDAYAASKGTVQRTASEIAAARLARLKGSALPKGGKIDAPKSEADMSEQELRSKIGDEVWAED